MEKELITLAKAAKLFDGELFGTMDGELTICCKDNVYRTAFDLKMIIDPCGDFAQMSI